MRYTVEPYQHGYHVVDHGKPCLHTWSLHQHVAERWCAALNTAYASWIECSSVVRHRKAQIMTFSPLGGSNWSVGKVLGTYDTSDEVQMSESGVCDMEDVELALRRHFGIADDVECPEYPY